MSILTTHFFGRAFFKLPAERGHFIPKKKKKSLSPSLFFFFKKKNSLLVGKCCFGFERKEKACIEAGPSGGEVSSRRLGKLS